MYSPVSGLPAVQNVGRLTALSSGCSPHVAVGAGSNRLWAWDSHFSVCVEKPHAEVTP
jgi:hypothetical protein